MVRVHNVITFGCRLNIYESEIIRQNLAISKLEDVAVINTCAVTQAAEMEAKQAIRKLKRQNPEIKIIVTGCAAQINPTQFSKMSQVDKVLGNEEKLYHTNYHFNDKEQGQKILVNDIMSITEAAGNMVQYFAEHSRAFIEIQNGCDHRCTFCIIPYGRGNSRSVPLGMLVKQVRELVIRGYREVVLTGVDITSYGSNLPGAPSFAQMIRRLLALVPDLPRLRLSSIDVAEIDEELFELMAFESRLMPHFHISLQAGDNMILKRMKRRHNREQVIEFCHRLRQLRSGISFGADIIAGFPTETEEMFTNTVRMIQEADLQFLHVFPYSEREGTPAARMPQVDIKIRRKRAAVLRELGEKNLQKFLRLSDKTYAKVLVEKPGFGYSENFLPVQLNPEIATGQIAEVQLSYNLEKHMIGV